MAMLVAARDEDGRPMSDEEIRDEMITMLVVGHETTATSLAWVMHCLLENPNVLETVRAEVASAAGTGPSVPRPPAEEIAQLGYLDAVIKETARLHPVVPIVGRQIETDMRVGDHELPAGSIVAPCIYLTHRRPDLWPDPDAFTPARFVGRRVDPYMFFPFGGGVRHCLGAAFATYEMKIVLARVLSRVTLRPDPDHTVRVVRRGLLLGPSRRRAGDTRVGLTHDGAVALLGRDEGPGSRFFVTCSWRAAARSQLRPKGNVSARCPGRNFLTIPDKKRPTAGRVLVVGRTCAPFVVVRPASGPGSLPAGIN